MRGAIEYELTKCICESLDVWHYVPTEPRTNVGQWATTRPTLTAATEISSYQVVCMIMTLHLARGCRAVNEAATLGCAFHHTANQPIAYFRLHSLIGSGDWLRGNQARAGRLQIAARCCGRRSSSARSTVCPRIAVQDEPHFAELAVRGSPVRNTSAAEAAKGLHRALRAGEPALPGKHGKPS